MGNGALSGLTTAHVEPQRIRRWFATGELHRAFTYVVGVGALTLIYYGSARLGYALRFSGSASILWLPVGFSIAFVYLRGMRYLPGVLIGDVWVHDYSHLALGVAFGLTLANLLEVVVGAGLIQRLIPGGFPLKDTSTLTRLVCALGIATLTSALIGSTSLRLGGLVSSSSWPDLVRTWWLADFAGALVVVPLALAWSRPQKRNWERGFGLELVLMLIVVAGLTELALHNRNPLTYLIFPGLIWCALRFGQRGATLAIAEAVALTVWNATHHRETIVFTSMTRTVLDAQLFIAVAVLSTLYLVALVSEREEFAERLGASRAQLLHAADEARERIERDLHDGAQQRLVALAVRLHLAATHPGTGSETRAALEAAEADLQAAIDELRELAHGTYPSVLADLGLARAISGIAAGSDLPITLDELPTERLDAGVEATAYFVVAEALTNARKHAQATEIHVRARVTRGSLRVEVLDDGVGGAVVRPSAGLSGLRDRVELAGGRFDVVSSPGHGTRVTASIPLAR